ncbi:MAG: hypothetical protein AAGD33_04805 [Actinomycetota bacterium]
MIRSTTPATTVVVVASALVAGACASDEQTMDDADGATTAEVEPLTVDLPAVSVHLDLQPTGTRVIDGSAALAGPPDLDLPIPSDTAWVFGLGGDGDGRRWVVIDGDGIVRLIGPDGEIGTIDDIGDDVPVTVDVDLDGRITVRTVADRNRAGGDPFQFVDPLPDTRVVEGDGSIVALGGPTDRYRHGVLGDILEASTVEVITPTTNSGGSSQTGAQTVVDIAEPDVIEAVSPMLGDVDGDDDLDVVLTLANADVGARLAAYDLDGTLIAESDPVGLGNRWRNLLAVAPVGPNGEIEVIDVLTPHIGGVLQFHRVEAATGRLDRVAATAEYSTHAIGSRNLDLGIVVDADGDGRLDVVVPTQDRSRLVAITRVGADPGIVTSASVDLGARMTSNLAATPRRNGTVDLAVTTADDRLLVWYGS